MPLSPSPRFHDGQTSQPKEVRVEISGHTLLIMQGKDALAQWSYADIFVKEDWVDGIGAILGCTKSSDASLAILDHRCFLSLQSRLPRNQQASFLISTRWRTLFALTVLSVAAVWALFPVVSRMANLMTHLVPASAEQKLGEIALSSMKDEFTLCEDPAAKAALNKIIARLNEQVEGSSVRPDIYLFRTDVANAFTLPGSRMAIFSGLLHGAKNETELAGVLAHEIGHMVKRDPLEAYIEAQGFGAVAGLAGSSGAYGGVAQVATVMQTLKYSREKEFAADHYAVGLLHRAGYSADGLSGFLARMDKEESGELEKALSTFEFLSTHPDTEARIQLIARDATNSKIAGHKKASLNDVEFRHLKEACSVTQALRD